MDITILYTKNLTGQTGLNDVVCTPTVVSCEISASFNACTPEQLAPLKKYLRSEVRELYGRFYDHFVEDRELDEQDLQTLISLQQATRLTDTDIRFEQLVKPYYYVNSIRNEGALPTINLEIGRVSTPIVQRGEVVRCGYSAAIIDTKTLQGVIPDVGAQGIDFRLTHNAKYRVGTFAMGALGQNAPQNSVGTLFIRNTRVFLQPEPGNKPVSIPLNRILTFNCFGNGIEIWQEGREQAYLFAIPNSGAVEVFALCLIFILDESFQQYMETETNPFRRIPTEVKNQVLARDGHRCVICGSSDGIHFDHIIPVSKGGDNTIDNIQILCKDCNLRMSNKIL